MGNNTVLVNLNDVCKIKAFVRECESFDERIEVVSDNFIVDGKSLLGVLSLDLSKPINVKICAANEEKFIEFAVAMKPFMEIERK